MRKPTLLSACTAEFIGTFILVFFGVGSVNAAVLAGVTQGLWQVAAIWGVGVALAIYATGAISGAHLNPAITVAMAVWRGFSPRRIAPYILAQVAGAFCCSLLLYGLFHGLILHYETVHHLVRGGPGSELAAMVFGEYFPNPAMFGTTPEAYQQVTLITACLAEAIGTAFLACFVFTLSAPRGPVGSRVVPLFIGLSLAIIIMIVAPLTQAGLNPARDFGPRLVAYLYGWGHIAIPGPRGGFFVVYILAPILGAVLGSGVYQWLARSLAAASAPVAPVESAASARGRSDEVELGLYDETPTAQGPPEPTIALVPCAVSGRVGCDITHRAAEIVAASASDVGLLTPQECPTGTKSFLVAMDASSTCRASEALLARGLHPGVIVSAPDVFAQAHLLRPGVDPRAHLEELAQALAEAVRASLQSVISSVRERRRYRDEMAPLLARFHGLWERLSALPAPNGAMDESESQRVELLGRRARNLFVKLDDYLPPTEWVEAHDLFQDALLCVAFATEGWVAGERDRWDQNMAKARSQIKPLLHRMEG